MKSTTIYWGVQLEYDPGNVKTDVLDFLELYIDEDDMYYGKVILKMPKKYDSDCKYTIAVDKRWDSPHSDLIPITPLKYKEWNTLMYPGMTLVGQVGSLKKDSSKVRTVFSGEKTEWAEEAIKAPFSRLYLMGKVREGAMSFDVMEKALKCANGFQELDRIEENKKWAVGQKLLLWQEELNKIMNKESNMRDVYWIYDKVGN